MMFVNVRSHIMFRPELICIFDLIVSLMMKQLKIDVWVLKNCYKAELLNELHNTMPHYSAQKICKLKDHEKK